MTAVDHDARLEPAYRRLLLAYPAAYRQSRGDEIVSTLLAAAPPGRRRPTIAEAADLVHHGIRTRARSTRRALTGPDAAEAMAVAAVISLTVAAAVAVAMIVGVSVLGQPAFYRSPESGYPPPVRAGTGLVLATFPAALACLWASRPRMARWLTVIGGLGTIGLASWLAVHALDIENTRLAAIRAGSERWPELPSESLEPSNLFGLVTLLCVPGVLLAATRSASDRPRVGRGAALAGLLGTAFVVLTATDLLQRARLAVLGPEGTSTGPAPSLHDTGLTQGVVVALIAAAAWYLLRHPRSRGLTIGWALGLPALGYAIGTLVTPMAFRPGWSSTEGLARNLLEVAFVSAVVTTLAILAISSWRPRDSA
jgi:hypothetical protein